MPTRNPVSGVVSDRAFLPPKKRNRDPLLLNANKTPSFWGGGRSRFLPPKKRNRVSVVNM
ncbi:hypothetical protein [Planktothricoides sp. SR001]|uniref:hypothetical protein n=1 Tax=Planktothricoides sp. SR001 TaxID=1705388 RepID=UPI0012E19805|nr:hypothetical protein [Planktothricoides sp. SR001]